MKKIALLVGAVAVSTVGQIAWAQNAPAPVVDTLTTTVGSNTFTLATIDAMDNLRVNRTLGAQSAGGYENANASGYTYNASSIAASGLDLNTTFTGASGAPLVHVIDKANATVTAQTGEVTYNGLTQNQAIVNSGLMAGDVVTVSGVAMGRNVGTYSSTLAAGGADAGNYNITLSNGVMTIHQARLLVSANAAVKVADGNTSSAKAPTVTGLVGADILGITPTQSYDTASVGIGKTLTAAGLVVDDGNGGANYAVTYVANNSGVIVAVDNKQQVSPSVPTGKAASQVNFAVSPDGNRFALSGVEAEEECSSSTLEKCICEELQPIPGVVNSVSVAICAPVKVGSGLHGLLQNVPVVGKAEASI